MKKISDQDLQDLITAYQAGYSKTLNYEDPKKSYDENNQIRWAREVYEKFAKRLAYKMALEIQERRQNEI